jgi:hypothetical protein
MQFLKDKIDQLNHEAWEVRVSDSTRAFALSQEATKLARDIGCTKDLAEGLRTFGFSHIRLSKNSEIKVETENGEGSTFIIALPFSH